VNKQCSKCGIEKPLNEFYRRKANKDKLSSRCKSCEKSSSRNYYRENKDSLRAKIEAWRKINREQFLATNKSYNEKLRFTALQHYSHGEFKCACCGESMYEFLTIDHINNDGAKMNKKFSGHKHICSWLKRNNYPEGFQVLCINCNFAKGKYGKCPHQRNADNVCNGVRW
jgi:hypothetical protein